jgi:DNA-binding beta-propeller fold protein YncE
MPLTSVGIIEIPGSAGRPFDHGAFDPKTRRVFVAHTGCNCVEVIDHDSHQHVGTLPNFPEAAGVVADEGQVLVTNRGAASLAWLDGDTLETRAVFKTGHRPNGVAIVSRLRLAVVACIGDETQTAKLQALSLDGDQQSSIDLPGRPRWCVTDAEGERVFLAIREPSMVLTARLPKLDMVQHWTLPSTGAHGLDIDREMNLLYVSCDGASLVEMDSLTGSVHHEWPLSGVPDATFFNPSSGRVHVAVGDPGLVQTIDPRTGTITEITTGPGAKTTALVAPDQLYVFSPSHGGAVVLADA